MPTATDEKLASDLASYRAEVAGEFNRLADFRGTVQTDLRWIKGIGAALLLAAFSFAAWIIADMATLKSEVRQLHSDVTGLKTDVTGLKTDVTGLKTDVAGLRSDVKAQSQALDRIEKALAANRLEKRPQ